MLFSTSTPQVGTSEDQALQIRRLLGPLLLLTAFAAGCASPYHADRGALFGGAMGAGLGAVAGAALGDPLAGAAIGGIAGTMTGAVAGSALDDIEARNRAEIAAHLGRPAPLGAVTIPDVIAMTQSGVSENVIATHVRNHGLARPLTSSDIIYLQQNGVSPLVVSAMQAATGPVVAATPVYPAPPAYVVQPAPPPVVVVEPYPVPVYRGPRRWGPPPPPRPGISWGVSVSSDRF
jgi:hypothetical protein